MDSIENAPQTDTGREPGWDAASAFSFVASAVAAVWEAFSRWDDRRRQRRHLADLDDHLLDDIGVTRKEARRAASHWFLV